MKVKDLIKKLRKCDPEAIVVVEEYNGWDDACRAVRYVSPRSKVVLAQSAVKRLGKCKNFVRIGALGDG